jgi:hypothetical protein
MVLRSPDAERTASTHAPAALTGIKGRRDFMFWDLMQHFQIHQAQADAESAKSTANDAQMENRLLKERIQTLEETVERLSLATMATAEILRDRFGVTEKELEAKIQEIDLRDGKLDGRFRQPRIKCPQCRYINAANRCNCLFCGKPLPVQSALFVSPTIKNDPDWDAPPKKP